MGYEKNYWLWKKVRVGSSEYGLHFCEGEFQSVLQPGTHWFSSQKDKDKIDFASRLTPLLGHSKADEIITKISENAKLAKLVEIFEVEDGQRALFCVEGRFQQVLEPGRYAYWNGPKKVKIEIIDATQSRFEHKLLPQIFQTPSGRNSLMQFTVMPNNVGLLYYDKKFEKVLPEGLYTFWRNVVDVSITMLDVREQNVDIVGQELMTSDKVSLRMNACFGYKITNAEKMSQSVIDLNATLYREAQLALRNAVGRRDLDQFLSDKNEITKEVEQTLKNRTESFGVAISAFGIRDVILPGEMKTLLNKVTEAKKAAEANLIARREETAAMRSQANTAKLLENNPTLMRLRELEVLEKIISSGKLQVVLGDKGLSERVINML